MGEETDALVLPFQAVTHVERAETLEVLDDPAHVVGIPAFAGLAMFADGRVVPLRYAGWFDIRGGLGEFRGAARWQFADGDLGAVYDGQITAQAGTFELAARLRDFAGTGRYAGVRGEGDFTGRRYAAVADGGTTHLAGTLRLVLAGAAPG